MGGGCVKRHLYSLATELQEALRSAAGERSMPIDWQALVPRAQIDAWSTLYRWSRAGEPIVRLTEEAEEAMLDRPLPADLPLMRAPLATEALACQLPTRSDWIVVARHVPEPAWVQVWGELGWRFSDPVLTYVARLEGQVAAGYLSLLDHPTPADLRLRPGWLLRADGRAERLGEAEVMVDEFALALGVDALFRRSKKNQKKV